MDPSTTAENRQQATAKMYIVGVGDDGVDGLTHHALEILKSARTVLGPPDLLEKVASGLSEATNQKHIPLEGDLDQACEMIASVSEHPSVILTGGDPLFYGLARYLCDRLGKERFEVIPHVSSMQLAFARVKESWDDAYLLNLATQPLSRVVERIRTAEKAGVFTSDEHPPQELARALLDAGIDYFTAYVCENLGSPDERITRGDLQEIARTNFSNPNVVVLVRRPGVPDAPPQLQGQRLFGNPDELFHQDQPTRGLLTQMEVRVIALAEMSLQAHSIVWDVGAGTGSVSIEAAQLARDGRVYAIEMSPPDFQLLQENIRRFGVTNVVPILGQAPEAWQDLPDPDAVFVGGTGRQVAGLVQAAWRRLRHGGSLVAHVGSLDNLMAIEQAMRKQTSHRRVVMVNLARSQQHLEMLRLESINPSFLFVAVKQED